jgi:RNA-directed DNA polymerase
MTQLARIMKINNDIYPQIYNKKNLILAYKKARKGKTKKDYVLEFEKNLRENIINLHTELQKEIYSPKPLVTFILRDPKTRRISKSDFRDRIIHHALYNVIEPIFDKSFIYDNCANRKNKGTIFAIKRFDKFKRKVSKNNTKNCFILKADIKHYFHEVSHRILIKIIQRKIKDKKVIFLIKKILENGFKHKTMPLGNLTSQFFANLYLNDLDYFVKHLLKAKYYIRYVDDFVIFHNSKEQLQIWKNKIDFFLREKLKLEIHPQKSNILLLSKGIDFVGFRNFYYFRLLRKRNIKKMFRTLERFNKGKIFSNKFDEILQGWTAYANQANTHKIKKRFILQ